MAALEDFENTLKEVVNAKRVSASKMTRLTEIAMKSLADDTKLVAILYRTHKSLPSSAKVSSLYAFDALARAARSLVNKRGTTDSMKPETNNTATFLLKIEGVLDGLFQDMASLDTLEAKEKTKKVLDIWVKSNTFPPAVLTRLRDILSDVRKETAINPSTPTNPHAAPETITIPAVAPADVQATLLALLGQAAQMTSQGQPCVRTPPNAADPQLQQSQLALLQQLALTAKLTNGSPTPPPGQTPPPLPPTTDGHTWMPAPEPTPRPLQTGTSRSDTLGDARYGRNGHPDGPRDRNDFRDERHVRGNFRGGSRGRGRWDDHNRDRFRQRDREWDSPLRPRRSRSRSPRRPEEWRNMRRHSPPHYDRDKDIQAEIPTPTSSTHGKDEFGRDIRASSNSPSRSTSVEDTQTHAPMESSVDPTPGVAPDNHIPVSDQLPLVAASTSAESTETHTPSSASQQQPGLDHFDISTFDATVPSSWEVLGNMWQVTHGYTPSQEELMHFVMTETMAAAAAGMADDGVQGDQWQQGSLDPRRNGGQGGWARGNYGDSSDPSHAAVLNGVADETKDEQTGKGGGRMQRVGDKWVFVRDVESMKP